MTDPIVQFCYSKDGGNTWSNWRERSLGAVGEYNGKFMNDQHVLRGASAITPASHARVTYRNFFPAASRWAFSGLRLAR